MKYNLIFILLFAFISGMPVFGVPAFPKKICVRTSKNDSVAIQLKGDEYFKYAIDEYGHVVVPWGDDWYYASSEEGIITNSGIVLDSSNKTVPENVIYIGDQVIRSAEKSKKPQQNSPSIDQRQALVGEYHSLIILMQFQDQPFKKSVESFERLFNQLDYSQDGAKGSVKDFYRYASWGQFDLTCDIYGPYTSSFGMDYYGRNDGSGNDVNPVALVKEALMSLPADIDLSNYDNDCDGRVDNVHVIFSGYGEESGASPKAIWSHEYPYEVPVTLNGYRFAGYSCTPELRSNIGSGISRIGVICHELGHAFGANDYYDVDYEKQGSFEGTGIWDLMASGSWNNNGVSPANINPFVKIHDFGWVTPKILNSSQSVRLDASNTSDDIVLIPISVDEYYLAEYRQKSGFDSVLPGAGVLFYHVHPEIEERMAINSINSRHPQCLYIVAANNESNPAISKDYGDINSDSCPFPGSLNKHSFGANTSPVAFSWTNSPINFEISDIKTFGEYATLNYMVEDGYLPPLEDPTYEVVCIQDFETGMRDFTNDSECSLEWKVYPTNKGEILYNVPTPHQGKRALMLFESGKGIINLKGCVYSGPILLDEGNYKIVLDLTTSKSPTKFSSKFNLDIQRGNTWDNVFSTEEHFEAWTEIEIPFEHHGGEFNFKLTGIVRDNGIFVDNIRILKDIRTQSKISTVSKPLTIGINHNVISVKAFQTTHIVIFNELGFIVTNKSLRAGEETDINLPPGLYILTSTEGFIEKIIL